MDAVPAHAHEHALAEGAALGALGQRSRGRQVHHLQHLRALRAPAAAASACLRVLGPGRKAHLQPCDGAQLALLEVAHHARILVLAAGCRGLSPLIAFLGPAAAPSARGRHEQRQRAAYAGDARLRAS